MKNILVLLLVNLFYLGSQAQWYSKNPSVLPTNAIISSIQLTNSSTAFLAAGTNGVFKSSDGGDNWTATSVPTSNNSYTLFFIDNNNGFVAGDAIYKTNDAGTTWTALPAIAGALFTPNENIQFTDNNTGFVNASHGSVFKTSDGGTSWSQIKSSGGLGSVLGMCFLDNNTGYTVGYQISKTTNGGTSWIIQTPPTSDLLYATHFINNNEGWAVGDAGIIIKTIDGGTNWTTQTSGVTSRLQAVHFINNMEGLAVGRAGVILKTTDGGTTWTSEMSSTTENLFDIHFLNSNTALTGGTNNTLLKMGWPTSIAQYAQIDLSVKAYPIPAINQLTISTTENILEYKVYNCVGKLVASKETNSNEVYLNTSKLSSGTYYVVLNTKDEIKRTKIIVL